MPLNKETKPMTIIYLTICSVCLSKLISMYIGQIGAEKLQNPLLNWLHCSYIFRKIDKESN